MIFGKISGYGGYGIVRPIASCYGGDVAVFRFEHRRKMMDVYVGFKFDDPADKQLYEEVIRRKEQQRMGVPTDLIDHVKKRRVGTVFIVPIAEKIVPNKGYTAEQLGRLVGGMTARQVASKLNVLGRSEAKLGSGQRVFKRLSPGMYTLTPEIRDAILAN